MSGIKYDQDKPDLSLIPYVAEIAMAKAFGVGARKYSRDNYKAGMEASRLVAACKRHLGAWFDHCEELDQADGQPHLGSALACIAMILRLQELGTLKDDRYKKEQT